MTRSSGFSLGGTFQPNLQQQQLHATAASSGELPFAPGNSRDLRSHGSDFFPSHENYYAQIQNSAYPSIGLRALNSVTPASGMNTYEQLLQQYQQSQSQSQFQLQQMSVVSQSYKGQNVKSTQGSQVHPDPFCMLGLLSVISMHDPDLTSLALGIDLTMVGLSLNSTDSLIKHLVCLGLMNLPKGSLNIAFQHVIMPKHRCLYMYARGWFYLKDQQLWFTRALNSEPLVKTHAYAGGLYLCFDPNTWSTILKHFVLHYDAVEKKPIVPSDRP